MSCRHRWARGPQGSAIEEKGEVEVVVVVSSPLGQGGARQRDRRGRSSSGRVVTAGPGGRKAARSERKEK